VDGNQRRRGGEGAAEVRRSIREAGAVYTERRLNASVSGWSVRTMAGHLTSRDLTTVVVVGLLAAWAMVAVAVCGLFF